MTLDMVQIRKWIVDAHNGYLAPAEEVFNVIESLADLHDALTKRLEAAEVALDAALACVGPAAISLERTLNRKMEAWQQVKAEAEEDLCP